MSPSTMLVPRLGAILAAVCGAALVAALFLDWYAQPIVCITGPCPQPGVSGWAALRGEDVLLAGAAAVGLALPLVPRRASVARFAAASAALVGLAAALLVVARFALPPGAGPTVPAPRLVGIAVALAAALGMTAGALLAAAGDRLATPGPRGALLPVVLGALLLAAALFLPWIEATTGPSPSPPAPSGSLTAWQAFRTSDILLALAAGALLAGAAIATALRWRALYIALAFGGWLAAAIVVVSPPFAFAVAAPGAAYALGYWLALAGGAAAAMGGVAGAAAADQRRTWRSSLAEEGERLDRNPDDAGARRRVASDMDAVASDWPE